jgi:hypothetical protein
MFVITPITLVRNFGNLSIISYYIFLVLIISFCMICIVAPIEYYHENKNLSLRWGSWKGGLLSVGTILYFNGLPPAIIDSYIYIYFIDCQTTFSQLYIHNNHIISNVRIYCWFNWLFNISIQYII